jgi:hypothetical protein
MPKQQTDGPRDRAKVLLDMVLIQVAELDTFLSIVQGAASADEFTQLRTIVGAVMGSIADDAINPIVDQYPDLRPRQLDER